jgi:hypothetical protein
MDYIGFSDEKFYLIRDIEISEKVFINIDETEFEKPEPELETIQ